MKATIILLLICGSLSAQEFEPTDYFFPLLINNVPPVIGTIASSGVAAPGVPTIVSPTDNAINQSLTVTLDWSNVSGATTYGLLVDTDIGFPSPIVTQLALAISQYSIPVSTFINGKSYFWKVRATNSGGSSAYCTRVGFITIMDAPTLTSPANNATDVINNVTLQWNAEPSHQATDYRVYLTDFNSALIVENESTAGALSFEVGGFFGALEKGGTYTWYVTALSNDGAEGITSTFAFTMEELEAPILTDPSNHNLTVSFTNPVHFEWFEVADATDYRVIVSTDSTFTTTPFYDHVNGSADAFVDISGFTHLQKYYWKVTAINVAGESLNYSAVWDFTCI